MQGAGDVEFLRNIQRLLDEGDFTATYKFALLRAFADLSVELPAAPDGSLTLSMGQLADKFIEYYWRQSRPYRNQAVLLQNNSGQARVIRDIGSLLHRFPTVAALRLDQSAWGRLRRAVAVSVRDNPVQYLQNIGSGVLPFLYQPFKPPAGRTPVVDQTLVLRPGVPRGFRSFHALIVPLLEVWWLRQISGLSANRPQLGADGDLAGFLFGTAGPPAPGFLPVLRELQGGSCFYCERRVRGPFHLDHFIAWSRYPAHLGHNFVAACAACNGSKSAHLAAVPYLAKWRQQNLDHAGDLAREFVRRQLPHDADRARFVAVWAYEQVERAKGLTWLSGRDFRPLPADWRLALDPVANEPGPHAGAVLAPDPWPVAAEEPGPYDTGKSPGSRR